MPQNSLYNTLESWKLHDQKRYPVDRVMRQQEVILIVDDLVELMKLISAVQSGILLPDTKGQLISHDGTAPGLFPVGTDGRILMADSAATFGIDWKDPTILGTALTKTDDTNVTLTLGGTPSTSLLAAVSLTLGWTGQLSVSRGGTGLSALGSALQNLRVNAAGTALEYYTPVVNRVLLGSGRTTTAAPADTNTNIINEITIPANTLGANDSVEVIFEYSSAAGNVGQKTFEVRYGATSGTLGTTYLTTGGVAANNQSGRYYQKITCKNSTSAQEGARITTGFGTTTAAIVTSAIDTTADSYIQICIDKATAADTVSINNYEVWQNKVT